MKAAFFPGWTQVAVCLLLMILGAGSIISSFSVLAVPIANEFSSSRMVTMLPMTLVALASGFLSPVLGIALDRFSQKTLMLIAAFMLSAGFFVLSFTTAIAQVILVYALLLGPTIPLLGPLSASVLISRWFVAKRGAALGVAAAGISLGGIIMPLVVQALLNVVEWRIALRCHSLIVLFIAVPAIYLWVVNRPEDKGLSPDNGKAGVAKHSAVEDMPDINTAAILKNTTFWLIAIAVGVILFGNKGVLTNMVPLAIDAGTPVAHAALLISFFSGASFTAKLFFAAIADRFDPRIIICCSLLLFITGLVCFQLASLHYVILIAGSIFLGLASGGMIPLEGYLIAKAFGHRVVGRVMGLMQLATMPLGMLAPPLFGLVFDKTGGYGFAFTFFSIAAVGAIFLLPKIHIQPLNFYAAKNNSNGMGIVPAKH